MVGEPWRAVNPSIYLDKMFQMELQLSPLKEEMVIYEEGLITGGFTGVFYSETHPHMGRKHLSFKGSGHLKRIEINGIGLNISDLDPKRTHLEFYYDQGSDTARPRLYLPGIGSSQIEADNKPGYERIIIPFKRFTYVHGTLDRIIIKGIWRKDTNIFLDSIRLICH